MVGLGFLPGDTMSRARGVSADGSVVVGSSSHSFSASQAFCWTSTGGMVGLGDLAGGLFNSGATAVSADGKTVVGGGTSTSGTPPARWTSSGGWVSLGKLPSSGFFDGNATDVSADGSVIVGKARGASFGYEPFRWTLSGGMVSLGQSSSFNVLGVSATGVSADGNIIVGTDSSDSFHTKAFLWNRSVGMVNLQSYLIAQGVAGLAGWTLTDALDVSADGQTIVGSGIDPLGNSEAWIATIPEPSSFALAGLGLASLVAWGWRQHRA
jgi:probable HAF family extracellular repeat protein